MPVFCRDHSGCSMEGRLAGERFPGAHAMLSDVVCNVQNIIYVRDGEKLCVQEAIREQCKPACTQVLFCELTHHADLL